MFGGVMLSVTSSIQGHHTQTVQHGLRYGMILFIVSEIMFFFRLLLGIFHSSLAPTIEIGANWSPKGIEVLNPWDISFLNTVILLTSGASVTWAHHAILAGERSQAIWSLAKLHIVLKMVFTGLQVMEYIEAPLQLRWNLWFNFLFSYRIPWVSRICRYSFLTCMFSTCIQNAHLSNKSLRI